MQSSAATVDEFITGVEPDRIEAIRRLRDACRDHLPGWEESMRWGMPGYGPPGEDPRVSFNNQKNHIALYTGRAAIDAYKATLKGASFGKACVRFPKPDRIDFVVVCAMLDEAYDAKGGGC